MKLWFYSYFSLEFRFALLISIFGSLSLDGIPLKFWKRKKKVQNFQSDRWQWRKRRRIKKKCRKAIDFLPRPELLIECILQSSWTEKKIIKEKEKKKTTHENLISEAIKIYFAVCHKIWNANDRTMREADKRRNWLTRYLFVFFCCVVFSSFSLIRCAHAKWTLRRITWSYFFRSLSVTVLSVYCLLWIHFGVKKTIVSLNFNEHFMHLHHCAYESYYWK